MRIGKGGSNNLEKGTQWRSRICKWISTATFSATAKTQSANFLSRYSSSKVYIINIEIFWGLKWLILGDNIHNFYGLKASYDRKCYSDVAFLQYIIIIMKTFFKTIITLHFIVTKYTSTLHYSAYIPMFLLILLSVYACDQRKEIIYNSIYW